MIEPYAARWPARFEAERAALRAVLPQGFVVEHVGSTAVPGLGAEPIIDLMLGADSLRDIEAQIPVLEALGYEYRPEHEVQIPERRFFAKPRKRPRDFHLHAIVRGGAFWIGHLAFRDALRSNARLARQYEALKRRLASRCGDDRDAYTDAKGPFVSAVLTALRRSQR